MPLKSPPPKNLGFLVVLLLAVACQFLFGTTSWAQVSILDKSSSATVLSIGQQYSSQTVSINANANVFVVELAWRENTAADIWQFSLGGQPLIPLVNVASPSGVFVGSAIYYLPNPPTGTSVLTAAPTAPTPQTEAVFDYATLGNVNLLAPVLTGSDHNTAGANNAPIVNSVSIDNVLLPGSAAINALGTRAQNSKPFTFSADPIAGTAQAYGETADLLLHGSGGYETNLPTGSIVISSTTAATSADQVTPARTGFTVAVFAPNVPALKWTGSSGAGNWDTSTGNNWVVSGSGSTPVTYADYSPVIFPDGASTGNVLINSSTVSPAGVTFTNNTLPYVFSAAGGYIVGAGGVTLNGNGSVTFNQANAYTGATNVNHGTLVISSASAINASSAIHIGSGATLDVTAAGGYTVGGGQALGGSGRVVGGLVTASSGSVIIAGGTGSGTLTVDQLLAQQGSILDFGLIASPPSSDKILVKTSGGLELDGNSVYVYQGGTQVPFAGVGTFNLLQYSGAISLPNGLGSLAIADPLPAYQYSFGTSGIGGSNYLTLTVTQAQPLWSGSNGANWSAPGVWGSLVPTSSSSLVYANAPGGTSHNDLSNASFKSIQFVPNIGAFTLTGNGTTLTGDASGNFIVNNSTSTQTINLPITAASNGTINAATGPIVFGSSSILNTAGNTVTLSGSTNVTLAGTIVGGGNVVDNVSGTLYVNSAAALGTGSFTINGGVIDNSSGSPVAITGAPQVNWSGDFSFQGSSDLDLGAGGVSIIGGSRSVKVLNGTLTVSGGITGSPGNALAKTGNGVLALTGGGSIGSLNINDLSTISIGNGIAPPSVLIVTGMVNAGGSYIVNHSQLLNIGNASMDSVGVFSNVLVENGAKLAVVGTLQSGINQSGGQYTVTDSSVFQGGVLGLAEYRVSVVNVTLKNNAQLNFNEIVAGDIEGSGEGHGTGVTIDVQNNASINTNTLVIGNLANSANIANDNRNNVAGYMVSQLNQRGGTVTVNGPVWIGLSQTNHSGLPSDQTIGVYNLGNKGSSATLSAQRVLGGNYNDGTTYSDGEAYVNFHGGTLAYSGSTPQTDFLDLNLRGNAGANAKSAATIWEEAAIDNGGQSVTVNQPLLAPTGKGIGSISISGTLAALKWPIAPWVYADGDGKGFSAITTLDASGHINSITVTNPGTDFTTLTDIQIIAQTENVVSSGSTGVIIPASNATLVSNSTYHGGLTTTGTGTLTLTAANTYRGGTTVAAGRLVLGPAASLADGPIVVSSGATFSPQPLTAGSIVAGTTNASLTLAAGSNFDMSGDFASGTFQVNGLSGQRSFALSGGSLAFDVGATTTTSDELLISGGSASVSGTNYISVVGQSQLAPGTYTLISDPAGGLTGSFVLSNSSVVVGNERYGLSLNNSSVAETLSVAAISPVSFNWISTSSGTGLWASASNWDGGVVPGSTNVAVFSGTGATASVVDLGPSSITVGGITFNTNLNNVNIEAITNASATLILNNGATTAQVTVSGSQTISAPVTIGSNVQITTSGSSDQLTISGAIGQIGSGQSLTKAGPGKLLISGPDSFAGALNVTGGTVVLSAPPSGSSSLPGAPSSSVVLSSNTTLDLSASSAYGTQVGLASLADAEGGATGARVLLGGNSLVTGSDGTNTKYSGAISGAGGLSKVGAGAFTLAGQASYTGNTSVQGGTLALTGPATLASSPSISVASGATLDATGLPAGLVRNAGQSLSGGGTVSGNLTASGATITSGGSLTVSGNSTLNTGTVLNLGIGDNVSQLFNTSGAVTVTGQVTVNVGMANFVDQGAAYPIMQYASITGDSMLLLGHAIFRGETLDTTSSPTTAQIVVGAPASLTWVGKAGANIWSVNSDKTWNNTTVGTNPDVFYQMDQVTFDDTGATVNGGTVTIVGSLAPTGTAGFSFNGTTSFTPTNAVLVNVSAPNSYTFTGTGSIVGATSLTKDGNGTLNIANSNSFGGIDPSNWGYGIVSIHQGTINVKPGGVLTNNTSEIDVGDTPGKTGTLSLTSGTAIVPLGTNGSSGVNVGFNGGTGVLTLLGNSLLDASAFRPANFTNAIAIGFNNGTAGSSGTVTVGGTSTMNALNGSSITVGFGGNGVLKVQDQALVQASTFNLGTSGGTGTLYLNGGTLSVPGIQTNGDGSGAVGSIYFNGGKLQASAAFAVISGGLSLTAIVQQGGAVFDTNGNTIIESTPLAHDVSGPTIDGGLTKIGAGILQLAGSDGYTGPTSINAGVLQLANVSALGSTSAVTILSGGSLDLFGNRPTVSKIFGSGSVSNNSLGGIASLTVTNGGSFSGSIADGSSPTILNVTGGTLTLSGTDTYSGGTNVLAGILDVTNPAALLDGSNLSVGTNLSVFPGGATASSAGALAVPEPGTLALLAALAICGVAVHRGLQRCRRHL